MTADRFLLIAALVFSPFNAFAADTRPTDVATGVAKLTADCKVVKETPGFEVIADLNGDGIKDYILDFERAECDGSSMYFCGSAGCQMQVYLSKRGRFVEVYGLAAREHQIQKKNGHYVLKVTEHGSYCGRAGADECSSVYGFSGARLKKIR